MTQSVPTVRKTVRFVTNIVFYDANVQKYHPNLRVIFSFVHYVTKLFVFFLDIVALDVVDRYLGICIKIGSLKLGTTRSVVMTVFISKI